MIAVMKSGVRISIIQGEGADEECFAGELLNPTEREHRLNLHISCLWDHSRIERIEPCGPEEPDYGGTGL